jgi:hypothetical protein
MTTFGQNYNSYVGLYKNSVFKSNYSKSLSSVVSVFKDDVDAVTSLYSMVGLIFSNKTSQINFNYINGSVPNKSIFYNFWNSDSNIKKTRDLLQAYLLGTGEGRNNTQISNFQDINNIVTFILSFLFSSSQYSPDGNPTSFPVNLLDVKNNQPAVINIKNFLQSNVSSSENNLLGAGNYQMSFTTNNGINTASPLISNSGFISILCNEQYSLYQKQNNNLSGEKLINSYRTLVSQTEDLLNFCGCYSPIPSFFHSNIQGFSQNIGDSPCDPLCYNNQSFKLYENNRNSTGGLEGGGAQQECNANVCVIDNSSINSLNSNGDINFNQTCRGCNRKNSTCLCFIDVSTNQLINKISSGNTGMMSQQNFKQNCTGNSVCFQYDNGEIKEVKCNEINTPLTGSIFDIFDDGVTKITSPEYIPDFFWLIVMIIFFLLILFIYQIIDY